jgi:hypothetical protein
MILWRPEEHESPTDEAWDAGRARESIAEIVADAEGAVADGLWPGHPLDDVREDEHFCSLYLGSAGIIWALAQLGSSLDCAVATATALERYRAAPDFESDAHPPSLLMGETGLLVVADKTGSSGADRDRLRELIRENREHPTREMMWGSPGTILAAVACGLEDEAHDSAEVLHSQWDRSADTWSNDLYGRVQVYLGPPHPGLCHGTAGNGFALLRLHELTRERVWLERARRFAMHAIEQVSEARKAFGRGRYTLWTGDVGVALYLRACLVGHAEFPTIDAF